MRHNNALAVSILKMMAKGKPAAEKLVDKITSFTGVSEGDVKISYQEDYAAVPKEVKRALISSMDVNDVLTNAIIELFKSYSSLETTTDKQAMLNKALDYQHRHIIYRSMGYLAAKLMSVGDYEVSLNECNQEAVAEYVAELYAYQGYELHKLLMDDLAVESQAA